MEKTERQGPGRRPEEDKKVQVAVYIKQSHVEALGGIAAARMYATDQLEEKAREVIKANAGKKSRSITHSKGGHV